VLVHEPHDLLFTSDREAAQVTVFHCSDERRLGRAGVGLHPNGLAYDSRRRLLYAFNLGEPLGENCTVSVVDVDSLATVSELPLPGRPRWAVYDEEEDRIYVNIREPGQIVAIDPDTRTIAGTLDVPSSGPHGLWLDRGRLFCAADGGDLVVLSLAADILASVALPGAPDVVMHDAVLRRLYVAIGEPGVVWSFDTDRLVHLETIATEEGAHTLGLDPIEHRLYVFQPRSCGASVYEERA
jgi:DNA-binding beta-propeller fold protein YncE